MVRVQCPHCERRYRTRVEAFGRTAVCTKCNATFRIGESRPPFEWKSQSLAEDSWIGVEAPAEKVERKHCIICDAPLRPGEIRCPECGANQVTGMVNKRKPEPESRPWRISHWLPLRTILVFAVLGAIACVTYLVIAMIARSTVETAVQLKDETVLREASKYLREGGSELAFADVFGGRVNDENLPRFTKRLSAGDVTVRKAASLLIGAGNVSSVAPLVEWAKTAEDPMLVKRVFWAVGARRLVDLSNSEDASVREAAAHGMLLLAGKPLDEKRAAALARKSSPVEKIAQYNESIRAWPEAAGAFTLTVNETPFASPVTVQQIGPMFYLRIADSEFPSQPNADRRFSIPIDRYCAATGAAVSPERVRELMTGSVELESPLGVGWNGSLQATMKRTLDGPLPGFLPVTKPEASGAINVPVRLDRAR